MTAVQTTPIGTPTVEQLVGALGAAKVAAEALDGTEDGGTCNIDCVAITLPRWSFAKVAHVAELSGIRIEPMEWFGRRRWFPSFPVAGQGNRRTRMMEAACKVLEDRGIDAMMYYQMD